MPPASSARLPAATARGPTTAAFPPPIATKGSLSVQAPERAPVAVDGKVRGEGPTTVKLAPGYHAVRVGNDKSQLVEIHRGATATVDFTH